VEKTYSVFKIPKKNGKFRVIEAPCDELKEAQRGSLWRLTKTFPVSPFATGFVTARNIAHNALLHSGQPWVACIDISDFFPSINWVLFTKEVIFENVEEAAQIRDLNFHDFGDGKGLRLPQGAPCSPFLSNLYLMRFDWQMATLAEKLGVTYSRYADDLVFSGQLRKHVLVCLKIAEDILAKMGLNVNHPKTKIRHSGQKQLVTGLVVNVKANVPRRERKRIRAALFQAKRAGTELSQKDQGRVSFLNMVNKAVRPASNIDLIGARKAIEHL